MLAKYKLAKPIMATVNRYYGSKIDSSSYSDDSEAINPLVILAVPLWLPVALIDCLNERSGFIDFCPFR
ncbi:dihydroxy-acid dehydratase [Aggregatibacter segnis]|uniref:Dihydroxy-acid dehydratase n=1 Tax=Aggregatibacter segnis TaxID=739 RepID=A0A8B2U6U2_9PAST|nr:dihydroxy-acid dehydratase [Aggregatibacter segnis]